MATLAKRVRGIAFQRGDLVMFDSPNGSQTGTIKRFEGSKVLIGSNLVPNKRLTGRLSCSNAGYIRNGRVTKSRLLED